MADPAGPEAQDDLLTLDRERALVAAAERLGSLATERGLSIATAESCTGGLIGHAITAVPGSSAYYAGGVISYADSVKSSQLAVPAATIERHGAVSAQVAVAMAEGARAALGTDLAVAVTGVAGPDGGTPAKPVGLTYIAVASAIGHDVQRRQWDGDRAGNKAFSALAALELLTATIESAQAEAGEGSG